MMFSSRESRPCFALNALMAFGEYWWYGLSLPEYLNARERQGLVSSGLYLLQPQQSCPRAGQNF
jgi:hypothetical protein